MQRWQNQMAVSPVRRVLGWIVATLLAPYASYVLVANVALNTGLLAHSLNAAQKDLVLSIDSGWTVWPARLHARGLSLRFEDANVQFLLTADQIATSIDVAAAFRKEFHTFWVRGEGVSYWFRHKLDKIEGDELRVAGFPIIPGYDPVPLRTPSPRRTTATADLWVVHLDDVRAQVRDFWMMEFRLLGDIEVSGSFELAPRRHLWLKDARFALDRGKLDRGKVDAIASRFSGTITAEYRERNPDLFTMEQNLAWTNWGIDVRAGMDSVDFLAGYLDRGLHVSGGKGPLRIAVQTRDAQLVKGSRATYSSGGLTVRNSAVRARIAGSVALGAHAGTARIDAQVRRAVLRVPGSESHVVIEHARGAVAFDHAGLERPWRVRAIGARVASASTGKGGLRLPGGFQLDGKASAKLVGRADRQGRLAGQLSAQIGEARLHTGKHSASGIGKVRARFLTRRAWLDGGTLFGARADFTRVTTRSGGDQVDRWWLVVQSPVIQYVNASPEEFHASVFVSARDGRPLIAALEEEGHIPGVVGFLWSLDHLEAQGSVRVKPGSTEIDLDRMESSSLGGKGHYREVAGRQRGVFLVTAGPFGMGFEIGAAGLSTRTFSGDKWFNARTRAVIGPLAAIARTPGS